MRPIPKKVRDTLSRDSFMNSCLMDGVECRGRIEWDHVFKYKNRQINEVWSIVPLCTYHHRGGGLDREYTEYRALQRATDEDLAKYPRVNWGQLRSHLSKKFGKI